MPSDQSADVAEKEFRERIEGKKVRDIAKSALGSHVDIVLDDGEPYTTITVRGENLSWEINEVRETDTGTEQSKQD